MTYSRIRELALAICLCFPMLAWAGDNFHRVARPIPNRYVVETTNKDVPNIHALAAVAARQHGARIITTYTEVLGGFAVEMTESQARALSRLPGIAAVYEAEKDELIFVPESSSAATVSATSWGLDRLDNAINGTYQYWYRGTGVYVYFLDSGVDIVGDLVGRMSPSDKYTFVGVSGTVPAIDTLSDCVASPGHGTSVASNIGGATYGVARDVRLISVATSSNCGSGGGSPATIAALNWIATRHNGGALAPAVVNISLAYGANASIDNAVRDAVAAGVTVVVGAGNDGGDACSKSPARAGNPTMISNNPGNLSAITVAASDINDNVSRFTGTFASNTGACVDVFAPGGPNLTAQGRTGVNTGWWGTSAASPHVAGIAALTIARYGAISPGMIETDILQKAAVGVISNAISGVPMLPGTPNRLVMQVQPARRRPCCS